MINRTWGFALAVMLMMLLAFASVSSAFTAGLYEKGFLVPVTVHNGTSQDTVVGVTCAGLEQAHEEMTVYWTFFDHNSHPVVDGEFTCSNNDLEAFSLNQSTSNIQGVEGYLVFTADKLTKDGCGVIAGNAFLIDLDNNDAIFVPVIPLAESDYKPGTDVSSMNADSIRSLKYGLNPDLNTFVDARYWMDPDFNAKTNIVIWSTACLKDDIEADNCYEDEETKEFKCHINVYDDDENRQSVSLPLGCELTTINPSDVVGWPDYKDGFARIPVKDLLPCPKSGAFVFSYIMSNAFGAAQTLLAAQSSPCEPERGVEESNSTETGG